MGKLREIPFHDMKLRLHEAIKEADVDYCEIRFEDSRDLVIQFQGQGLESICHTNLYGGNVRALFRGGWGVASFNNLDDLSKTLQQACCQAKVAGEIVNKKSELAAVPIVVEDVCPQWTLHPEGVTLSEKLRILEHYQKLILSYEFIPATTITYTERCTTLWFANSEGSAIRQEKLDFATAINANGRKGDVTVNQQVCDGSSLGIDDILNMDARIQEMCLRTQKLLDAKPVKAGVYTVICDPAQAGLFVHEAFGHLSEADDLSSSPFLEMMPLGRELGCPLLNIYDTGGIMTSRGALVFDDEGVRAKRTDLVKEGKLVGRLHSRESAARLTSEGAEVTGNARALSYIYPPVVRMRNTSIDAGDSSFSEMLKDIKLGVYAVGLAGGQTNGEMFIFGANYAYMIRDGKLAELVRDVKLMGNVFATLANIDMIGNDPGNRDELDGCGKGEQVPLPTGGLCPHIRIQNVILGGVR